MDAPNHGIDLMRYIDREMTTEERERFENHLKTCGECRALLAEFTVLGEVTHAMKIADLPRTVWDVYWTRVYNRIERRVAWFLFILGALIVAGWSAYRTLTDPGIKTVLGLGFVLLGVGAIVLFLSVLREKSAVNRRDRYIREVDR